MIESMKITRNISASSSIIDDMEKEKILTMSIDMVLLLTDFKIVEVIRDKYPHFANKDYSLIDDMGIQTRIMDRKIYNVVEWLHGCKDESIKKQFDYDNIIRMVKKEYGNIVYGKAEPTIVGANLVSLLANEVLKQINIVVDHDEDIRKHQINAIVQLFGKYAYSINIIIPDDENESFAKCIAKSARDTNTIMYDYFGVVSELEREGFDLDNMSITLSEMSVNFEKRDDGTISYNTNILENLKATEIAIGYVELKKFDDPRYFAVG